MSTPTSAESLRQQRQNAAEELHKLANGIAPVPERRDYLRQLAEFVEHNETVMELREALFRLGHRRKGDFIHKACIWADNSGRIEDHHRNLLIDADPSHARSWVEMIDSLHTTPTGPPEEITPGMEVPLRDGRRATIFPSRSKYPDRDGEIVGIIPSAESDGYFPMQWQGNGSVYQGKNTILNIDWPTYWQEHG